MPVPIQQVMMSPSPHPLPESSFVTRVSGPACTGCKSSSPAVANCFSCSALLCANCVIAHQLMVAFEVSKRAEGIKVKLFSQGHHVTNLGQSSNKAVEQAGGQSANSMDDVRKMVKEGKKKLNELQKTVKSVDYSSSRFQ